MTLSIERAIAATPEVVELITALESELSANYPPEQRHGLSLDSLFRSVGLRVETVTGELVGELARIEHNAAQDLLVITTPEREVLFPFGTALVPEVDVPGGRIVVDDRPGLLSEEL